MSATDLAKFFKEEVHGAKEGDDTVRSDRRSRHPPLTCPPQTPPPESPRLTCTRPVIPLAPMHNSVFKFVGKPYTALGLQRLP